MSDKLFLVTKTHIVKAKNMKHARSIIEGDEDIPGDLLIDNIFAKEVDEEQASHYFATGQDSFYDTVDEMEEDDDSYGNISPSYNSSVPSATIDFLRSENKRLARSADKYKNISDQASETIYRAAHDVFSNFELPTLSRKESIKPGKGTP